MIPAHRTSVALLTVTLAACCAAAEPPRPPAATPPPEKAPEKAPAPSREGRIDLRPKFEVGQVVRYTMKQTSDQTLPNAEDPKNPTKSRIEQTVGLKMTTKAIDKQTGEATVELVYESVKVKLDHPIATIDFDSTKPAPKGTPAKEPDPLDAIDGMVTDQFKRMVGTTVVMKVAKDGRIGSVTGGETLSPTLVPGLAIPAGDLMKQLGGLIGPITTNSTQGFDGTARVGDRWTHRDSMSVGPLGGLDMTTTYDLRSHSAGVAKVFFTGRAGSNSAGNPSPITVESAEHTGSYAWDTRLGQLVRCEMEQKTTLSGSLTGGKPSTATTTLVFERTGKK